ncbi:MAG TPA: PDZ domain-containing protein [Sedimenticola sp.]|nr:PDZ domain-containing protein [Sedimenticola sp.]
MKKRKILFIAPLLLSSLILGACQVREHHGHAPYKPGETKTMSDKQHPKGMPEEDGEPPAEGAAGFVLDLRNIPSLENIMPELSRARVVFVGEAHTSYGHHLSQLEIIRRLYEIDPNIAIGMEFFQQPFQKYLDAYSAGELEEAEMLRKTEYYSRWSFDYRLYRPILRYAREQGIPLIALNLPKEITRKVGDQGMDALTEEEKAQIPSEIDDSDKAYRKRMKDIFSQHPHSTERDFEHFLQVQLLWDEGMAARAADYLGKNPDKRLVVLAGIGHLFHGYGIPKRVHRRIPVETAVVLPWDSVEVMPGVSDFLLFPEKARLPPKGKMGVILADNNGCEVTKVSPGSAAEKGGVEKKDLILSLDGQAVGSIADLKIGLLDKKPGDKISIVVRRKRFLFGDEEVTLELELGQ